MIIVDDDPQYTVILRSFQIKTLVMSRADHVNNLYNYVHRVSRMSVAASLDFKI